VAYGVETGVGSKFGAIENDANDGPKLQAFLESCFRAAIPHLNENAAWYLWHAQMTQGFFAAAAAASSAAVIIHRQIIWVKPSLILGHGDYHWRHELCFYGWREGHRPPWYGDRTQTTVWEVGRENAGTHPTQKPVELMARPLRFNTKPSEIAFDPFLGSGTTLIAAEQLGRRCFGIEIAPVYCDVILRRYAEFTGDTPTREDGTPFPQARGKEGVS
jgi:DNA modification methylase